MSLGPHKAVTVHLFKDDMLQFQSQNWANICVAYLMCMSKLFCCGDIKALEALYESVCVAVLFEDCVVYL